MVNYENMPIPAAGTLGYDPSFVASFMAWLMRQDGSIDTGGARHRSDKRAALVSFASAITSGLQFNCLLVGMRGAGDERINTYTPTDEFRAFWNARDGQKPEAIWDEWVASHKDEE